MISIKVLGPGCGNCRRLAEIVAEEADRLGIDAQIQKLTEHQDFMKYQILMTPGLVINEKVVCAGRVPSAAEVSKWLVNSSS